jgi:hypothetical protein
MSKSPKKRIETSLVVAVITLGAAVIGSPLVFSLYERVTATATPTLAPNQVVVFSEDFEDDSADGFAIQSGQWTVGRDKSNKVLEVQADPAGPASAAFGPGDLVDGVVDFRVQFVNAAGFSFKLRNSGSSAYVLHFAPGTLSLGFEDAGGLTPLQGNSGSPYNFNPKQWYAIHVEAVGGQFTVTIDGDRLRLSAGDARLARGGLAFSLDPGGHVLLDDLRVSSFER